MSGQLNNNVNNYQKKNRDKVYDNEEEIFYLEIEIKKNINQFDKKLLICATQVKLMLFKHLCMVERVQKGHVVSVFITLAS